MKRTIALVLCIAFSLGLTPVVALANGDDPGLGPNGPTTHEISVTVGEHGRIAPDGAGSGIVYVDDGNNQEFEIEANQGYEIEDVLVDGVSVGTVSSYTFENVTGDRSIEATFIVSDEPDPPVRHTITATAGDNGSIAPSGQVFVDDGGSQSFGLYPDAGYRVLEVYLDGQPTGSENRNSFELTNVTQDHTVHVEFTLDGGGPGPGPGGDPCLITVQSGPNGSVEAEPDGPVSPPDQEVTVEFGANQEFTVTPATGFMIGSITSQVGPFEFDLIRNIVYNGDGSFTLTVWEVMDSMTLSITFVEESLDEILAKPYAVLAEHASSATDVETALIAEFGLRGYMVDPDDLTVINVDTSSLANQGYGAFEFEIDGVTSEAVMGFIVQQFSDVVFIYHGTHDDADVDELRVADASAALSGAITAPAMDAGTMSIAGVYNTRFEAVIVPDAGDSRIVVADNSYKQHVNQPFYRAQMHITNAYAAHRISPLGLNWYMVDLIQDDALCIEAAASSDDGLQLTLQWEFNRYAQLTEGGHTLDIYFANDIVTLSVPSANVGSVASFEMETGTFSGYEVAREDGPGDTYKVRFLSNFYDDVVLNVTLNGNIGRSLRIRRVGVEIEDYETFNEDIVFHGTQFGTLIDYSDGNYYRIYATYAIPDGGTTAPYGLYVTYTWANGTKTSEVITAACVDDQFAPDGVFIYDAPYVNCSDYLVYSGPNKVNAPVSVSVTVLKDDPTGVDLFGGVFFGSGTGVTWTRGQ